MRGGEEERDGEEKAHELLKHVVFHLLSHDMHKEGTRQQELFSAGKINTTLLLPFLTLSPLSSLPDSGEKNIVSLVGGLGCQYSDHAML